MRPRQFLSRHPALVRRLFRGGLVAGALLALGAVAVLGLLWALPLPGEFREPGRLALAILDRDGRPLAHRGVSPGGGIELSALPPHLPAAFIAFEDRRFRSHIGIDPIGIGRAAAVNLAALSWKEGASTLTQQLVKNAYLTPEKTLTRKIQEAVIAVWLERHLSKDAILARYLNSLYLGAGAHGVDAASRRYFGKPASEVSLAEAAMLAGLAQAPSRTAPTVAPDAAQRRAALVLDAMVETAAITPEQAAAAKAAPAALAVPPVPPAASAWAADWAAAAARAALGDLSGSLAVRTTIDPGLQALASAVVQRRMATDGPAAGAGQAALVAMRPDGRVLAVVGGIDHARSEFNRAVQARRQPGSLFKLFVYLAALQQGVRPDDRLQDEPVTIDGWSPENYSNRFHGSVTLRDAFAHSYNAASVRLQERVGRDRVIRLARSMGIDGPLATNPSLVLGTSEVSLTEITAAFAAIRAGTARVTPRIVEAVVTEAGTELLPAPAGGDRAAPDPGRPQAEMLDLLRAAVDRGTGRAARLAVPAYGKTGTTQDHRDAWFVGFAGDLVVGVWVGNDDGQPMNGVTGGGLPAQIWHAFMEAAPSGDRGAAATPVAAADEWIVGPARVIETGVLEVAGQHLQLLGVDGSGGPAAGAMNDYIGDRDVRCRPATDERYRCEVDGWDLSEVVLFNGGGRTTPDAPPSYRRAERKARDERRGVWAGDG